jgi:L-ascorbate metabolism protein UlaG (beta-lactamase superfamily)
VRSPARAPAPILPAPHRPDPATWPDNGVTLTWLGHASLLLKVWGTTLLVDPVLRAKIGVSVGPFVVGPQRLVHPALTTDALPPIDLLLLTHGHMDHTDLPTLRRLSRDIPVVVQSRNRDLVRRFRHTTVLAWGEHAEVAGVRVEAVPVKHWGARMIIDKKRGYGGYLLSVTRAGRSVHILLGGDTAHTDLFTPIGQRVPIDIAVLAIGAYDPWIWNHANPEQAWEMFEAMGARWLVPIHHATFVLSHESPTEPLQRLRAAAGSQHERIALTQIGETWTLPG